MKSLLTVFGVVFAHICIFLLLVNGCRGGASNPNEWNSDTSIYSAGAATPSSPATAKPAAAKPAESAPAQARSVSSVPAKTQPAAAETSSKPAAENAQPATTESAETHTVKSGEFLSTIALRYGLTAKELADANGIALNSTLKVGQVLKIPAAKPKTEKQKAPVEGEIYVVQKGDVLGTIARKHKVSVKQIKDANHLKNDVIRVGQKLVIPSKTAKKEEAKPATEEKKDAETKPAASTEAKPTESAPAQNAPESDKSASEDLAMPEGGFGGFGYSEGTADGKTPAQDAAPAESVPATGTPAE